MPDFPLSRLPSIVMCARTFVWFSVVIVGMDAAVVFVVDVVGDDVGREFR